MWDGPPLVRHEVKGSRRVTFQLHYTALGEEKTERIRAFGRQTPKGGLAAPLWEADYELNLDAHPGERIIPDFDPELNVRSFPTILEGRHVIGGDFGGTNSSKTALLAAFRTPKQIAVYAEHVDTDLPARIHKERFRRQLQSLRPALTSNWNFSDSYDAIGDVSGVGYKIEYRDDPHPLYFEFPGKEEGWRDRDANESLLNSFCAPAKRCCFAEWPDETEVCNICKKPLTTVVGLVVHTRCYNLRHQIPAWVRDEEGKRNEKIPHDALDALLYICRFYQRRGAEFVKQKEEKRPWWAGPEPEPEDGKRRHDEEFQRMAKGFAIPEGLLR